MSCPPEGWESEERVMRRLTTITRITITLVSLTITVFFAAQAVGLIPDEAQAALQRRTALCEAVGVQCSFAALHNDIETAKASTITVVGRHPEVTSAALRDPAGKLLFQFSGHDDPKAPAVELPQPEKNNPRHMTVPVFRNGVPWGSIELNFVPLPGGTILSFLSGPIMRLVLFIGGATFLAYLLYLKKTLQHLH